MRASMTVSDLFAAILTGLGTESVLFVKQVYFHGAVTGSYTWGDYTQMPGALITIRLFRFLKAGTRVDAGACLFLINGLIFAALALGLIYAFRLYRERHEAQQL